MLAQLIPLDGSSAVTLDRDITVVGRKRGLCDLVIDRSSISKMHCMLVKTDGLLFMRDLGSTNGTKVNGQRVVRGALLPGDQLAFAGVRFRVHLGPDVEVQVEAGGHEMTEILPAITDEDLENSSLSNFKDFGSSQSDVRPLSDSE